MRGHLEVARYLLEQGADRDKAKDDGYTPLHLASLNGRLDIAKLLMVYGAGLNAKTNEGELPIDMNHQNTEEIKQAIRDEPRRRMDEAPGKRATDQDRHPTAATSASTQQEEEEESLNKKPRLEGEAGEDGKVAEEDEDSEPSSDEDDN
jgi:Ankyrin repeats (many copies)